MKTINIALKERSYNIVIAKSYKPLIGILKKLNPGKDAFIVTNALIFKLHGQKLASALKSAKITPYFHTVEDSEQSKSISVYLKTITKISKLDEKKRLLLIAFGGGVVGDLCGFIAATYKRGVNYIQIPTTLLSQIDSAIGGKTGIDLPSGKNLIGAFFQPRLVYSNIELLKSLSNRQLISGLAEAIKYGIIIDEKLFSFMEKNTAKLLSLDQKALIYLINSCSHIKAKIVERDEKETLGLRTILNFGHTIGHALETATKYQKLTHGEAISIGMAAAAEISVNLGILSHYTCKRITNLITSLKLPVEAQNVDFYAFLKAFHRDKKFITGKIRMVLPTRIGHVIVTENIPFELIKNITKKRTA